GSGRGTASRQRGGECREFAALHGHVAEAPPTVQIANPECGHGLASHPGVADEEHRQVARALPLLSDPYKRVHDRRAWHLARPFTAMGRPIEAGYRIGVEMAALHQEGTQA